MEKNYLTILRDMAAISLDKINKVGLLNRFDSKFWIPLEKLPLILNDIQNDYYILKINDQLIQEYKTIYYDTPENCFYNWHHNGKSNRLKIRKREYVSTGDAFLEIKHKNNKGKTEKKRISVRHANNNLSETEVNFIKANTNCNFDGLEIKIESLFKRITLISREFNERCTIDLDLNFNVSGHGQTIEKLAIIELKQSSAKMKSKLSGSLKKHKIYDQGFSKYCIGRALTETSLKKNIFKPRLLKIERQFMQQ